MLTTLVGLPIEQLDTPALLIDLDALERNITTHGLRYQIARVGLAAA